MSARPLLALAFLLAAAPAGGAAPRPRVVVLGIDGASWNVVDPMLKRGELPTLRRLLARGAAGPLRSFEPYLSEIVWTTVATGKTPAKHGIDRLMKEGDVRISASDRKTKALWNIASERGLRVGVFSYRAAWPAEEVNGVMVPYETLVFNPRERRCHPAGFLVESERVLWRPEDGERARSLKRFGPFRYDPEYRSLPKDSAAYRENVLIEKQLYWLYPVDENAARLAERSAGDFDLVLVYWRGVDTASHGFWKYHARAPGVTEDEIRRFGKVIEHYYAFMDEAVGRVLRAAGEDAAVFVLSDHGFQAAATEGLFSGDHHPDGIWIAAGGPFRPSAERRRLSVLDVTPTLLHLLGLPVGRDMDGRAAVELFADARPVAFVDTHDAGGFRPPASDPMLVTPAQKKWLKELGYLR